MQIPKIVTGIGTSIKDLAKNPLELAVKTIGAATIGSVVYDTHINGKERAIVTDNIETADRFDRNYKQYMNMSKPSQTIADLKKYWFRLQQNFPWNHFYSKAKGYLDGAIETVFDNLPELGLSVLALATKKLKTIGKVSGILLALNATKTFLFDVAGVGSDKKI